MTEIVFRATFDGALFAKAALCASAEKTRGYLTGVHVSAAPGGGALLVATDGHVMVAICDHQGVVEGDAIVCLPPALLKAAKGTPRNPGVPVTIENGIAKVAELQSGGVLVDGSYPNWRRVIPTVVGTACGAIFNTKTYARVAEAVSLPTTSHWFAAAYGEDASSPHLVFGSNPNAIGVIVPAQRAGLSPRVPGWLAAPVNVYLREAI